MSARRSTATKDKRKGLRAALAAKTTRLVPFDVPVVDSETADAAAERLLKANNQLDQLRWITEDKDVHDRVRREHREARQQRDACFYRVQFRGLGDADFDALVSEHQPSAEQRKQGYEWNPDTFIYALIEACLLDGDGMTADDWRDELANADRWTKADAGAFRRAALDANGREFSDGIPKG